ncbi:beta chain spectrin [Culex quinquefasciatus]|uniref:Beta chain spectrin n=1 Tax=Culex quinquefasciatus TaxID=7176 RepID=B0X0X6_CULQU|nr:beta chain spectrin [Culex quinquefasciatus]|eukprot:XP_001863298.1 beta chain spectrin [Culex quinquefasciatus]
MYKVDPLIQRELHLKDNQTNKSCLALFHRPINRFRNGQQQCRWWLQVVEPSDRSGYAKNVLYLWNYLLELLRARRMRLEFSIQWQQNFQELMTIWTRWRRLRADLLQEHSLETKKEATNRAIRPSLLIAYSVWRMLTPNFANWPSSVVPGWKGAASCGSSTRTWSLKRTGSKRKHCFYRRDWSRFDHRHRRFLLFKHKPLEKEINSHEQHLIAVSTVPTEYAVDYFQLFADADDVGNLMLDVLRLVSSEDVGRDEQNVQILLKKHKHVADELKNYAETIELLHTQAKNLALIEPEQQKELMELTKLRKQRLHDALSLYWLFSESDGVKQWISEKERMLQTMNQAYSKLREQAERKRDDLKSAHSMQTFYIECRETISWIEDKKRILPETDDLLMELTGVTTLQRSLSGTECNLAASHAKLTVLERDHPDDLGVLTPGHFLIGEPMFSIPEPDYTSAPLNRITRLQGTRRSVQDFWKVWSRDYISQLYSYAVHGIVVFDVIRGTVAAEVAAFHWKAKSLDGRRNHL